MQEHRKNKCCGPLSSTALSDDGGGFAVFYKKIMLDFW